MYLKFFGLTARPFSLTPDPRFLYLTPSHREALAQLIYGVQEQKGFILLVGEVGTGKTTLLRALLKRLSADTAVAYVMNSTLRFDEMLEYILADFGVTTAGKNRAQRLMALNRFLIDRRRNGLNSVVIIDEAQNLTVQTLEQVRLLSNFETHSDKLLQIVLVGQPELRTKLQRPELRQLRQRIALRCSIGPMTPEEVEPYIISHLRIAGAGDRQIFTPIAVARIAEYSRGVPRVVNMLCDHCLLMAYGNQVKRVDRDITERAIQYLEEGEAPPHVLARLKRWGGARLSRYAVGAVAASVVVAGVLAILQSNGVNDLPSVVLGPLSDLARWWGR
jgi:type II secretory pathway predicted ATPase ExeA